MPLPFSTLSKTPQLGDRAACRGLVEFGAPGGEAWRLSGSRGEVICCPQPGPPASPVPPPATSSGPGVVSWSRDLVPRGGTTLACLSPPRAQLPFPRCLTVRPCAWHRQTPCHLSPATLSWWGKLAQNPELSEGQSQALNSRLSAPEARPQHGAVLPPRAHPGPSSVPGARGCRLGDALGWRPTGRDRPAPFPRAQLGPLQLPCPSPPLWSQVSG